MLSMPAGRARVVTVFYNSTKWLIVIFCGRPGIKEKCEILFHLPILTSKSSAAVIDSGDMNNSFLFQKFVNDHVGKVFYFSFPETAMASPAIILRI
jgi:hypothetical protein